MRTATPQSILKKLKAEELLLAKRRDHLREIISDFEALAESCDRALDALNDAVDALSELV